MLASVPSYPLLHCRCSLGTDNVVASDVRTSRKMLESGPFHYCDVQDKDNMARLMLENGITHVVHLATLLSGKAPGG
jgi:UDP-glucose 4-epimerase